MTNKNGRSFRHSPHQAAPAVCWVRVRVGGAMEAVIRHARSQLDDDDDDDDDDDTCTGARCPY